MKYGNRRQYWEAVHGEPDGGCNLVIRQSEKIEPIVRLDPYSAGSLQSDERLFIDAIVDIIIEKLEF